MSDKINVMLKEAHKRPHIKKSPLESPNDVIDLMKKRELTVSVGLNPGGYQIFFSKWTSHEKERVILFSCINTRCVGECSNTFRVQTFYLKEAPSNTFANRADPDQAALLRAA